MEIPELLWQRCLGGVVAGGDNSQGGSDGPIKLEPSHKMWPEGRLRAKQPWPEDRGAVSHSRHGPAQSDLDRARGGLA
ncbi:hypothetical protein AMTR_s00092p00130270 [Amborella trichopoda]|uniref:Uncharacterized protein n=1 Tax=Amborella trichopoda TaxID=13333 RepID=W1NV99_AMBTC|nr:hypothetical protein AMTR_s00092p00130270 [Amborella trichopoda]